MTTEDLKKLTVQKLRALAREHLGKGHSRFKTKEQLLLALKDALKKPLVALLDAADHALGRAGPAAAKTSPAEVVSFPPTGPRPAAAPRPAARSDSERNHAGPAQSLPSAVVPAAASVAPKPPQSAAVPPAPSVAPKRPQSAATPPPASAASKPGLPPRAPIPSAPSTAPKLGPLSSVGTPPATPAAPKPPASAMSPAAASFAPDSGTSNVPAAAPKESAFDEGLVLEGFFVNVPGERSARHVRMLVAELVDSDAEAPLPVLSELPVVGPMLLVRDPTTLFLFWDFRRDLERGAALGLSDPRGLLKLFEDGVEVRTLEVPLSSSSTYLEGLAPGRSYAVEAFVVGRGGWARPVGERSAPVTLPSAGPSASLEVRTVRVPWTLPLSRVAESLRAQTPSGPSAEPADSPRRVDLPRIEARPPGPTSPAGPLPGSGSGQN